MNLRIKLRRELDVICWNVTGEVSRARKRTWEVAVVRLAGQREGITEEDVERELLDGRRPVARRLLNICVILGLLEARERRYNLTEAGRAAADSGLVFIPEHGDWTIWAARDELLPSPLLRVEPWKEPSAQDEIGRNGRSLQNGQRQFTPVPPVLREARHCAQVPWAGDGDAICIHELEAKAEFVAKPDCRLTLALEMAPGSTRMSLSGQLAGSPVAVELPEPDLSFQEVWADLLRGEGLSSSWDSERGVMRVAFNETTEAEKGALARDIRFEDPALPRAGRFDPTTVSGVPLYPQSGEDASRWALWRLQRSLGTYATEERYQEWMRCACEPFADMKPSLPDRGALLPSLREHGSKERPGERYWYVQAPLDWTL